MTRALASVGAVVAALAACHGARPADDAAQAPAGGQAVVGAGTTVATARPFPQAVRAIGTVTPRPGRFAELAAPAPTRVAHIFVAPGQQVAPGDDLVEFERAPFDAAAKSAAAALESAQHAYARAVRLVQAGILPQKDSDQAAAELAQAQLAGVTARRTQQLATLRAPLGGVVTRMSAVLGASVDPSQPLVEVADPAALDVVFNVTPAEAAAIHVGDAVTVRAGEGAAVPIEALVPTGDGYQLFVVDSAGIAHVRTVTVGARTEALAEIVSGLTAGETVVTSGAYGVEDGARIVRTPR